MAKNMVFTILKRGFLFLKGSGECRRAFGTAISICALDQALKHAIDTEPQENFPRKLPMGKDRVVITRAHNPGFSQGRLSKHPEFVKLSSLGLTVALGTALPFFCFAFPGKKKIQKLGAAVLLGGALSNTYDRVMHGHVTDFLHIKWGFLDRSIINIGDIAIVSGTALYFLGEAAAVLWKALGKLKLQLVRKKGLC